PDPSRLAITPRYSECGPDGHLHTAEYLRYALQAAIGAGAAAQLATPGLAPAGWLEHVGDIGLQIRRPVAYGDAVEIQTRLARGGPPVWRWTLDFQSSGTTLARAFVDAFDTGEDDTAAEDSSAPAVEDSPAWDAPPAEPPE